MMDLIKAVEAPVRARRRAIESPLEDSHGFPALVHEYAENEDDPGVRLEIRPLTSMEDMLLLAQAAEDELYGGYDELPLWGPLAPDLRRQWHSAALQ